MSARLEVLPSDLTSLHYEVQENGTPVGTITCTPLRRLDKGKLSAGGREYTVEREGVLSPHYLLREDGGGLRARAQRQGFAGSAYRLRFDAAQVLLRRKVVAARETYLILDPSGQAGRVVRKSLLSRRLSVELGETASGLPQEIVLFAVWLAITIHRRDAGDPAGPAAL